LSRLVYARRLFFIQCNTTLRIGIATIGGGGPGGGGGSLTGGSGTSVGGCGGGSGESGSGLVGRFIAAERTTGHKAPA
jgi:hypothetical protein